MYQLFTLPFCPESPRYLLIKKNLQSEAESALVVLRNRADIKRELEDMLNEANMEKDLKKFSLIQLFNTRALLFPTVISVVLHLSQQLSGINAVFYYSEDILKKAGFEQAEYATPFIGLIMVVMTLISVPLMEYKGRRFLHLLGLGGMFIFSILMTVSFVLKNSHDWIKYLSIVSMMLYIVFFAIGPGSIPWMIVGELFMQGPKSAAISLAVLVNWSANVLIGQLFPPLFDNVTKEWTFILFSVLLALFWMFTYAFLPETKGKRPEEMALYFQDPNNVFACKQKSLKHNQVDSLRKRLEGKQDDCLTSF